jgi:hypothetical protein
MTITISQLREERADREAILDCLHRYARGIDRLDRDLLLSAYWEDATDDHAGMFSGGAYDFVDYALRESAAIGQTSHIVANVLMRLDGDRAAVESYVYAIHGGQKIDGAMHDFIGAGRNLDKFERRNGEWRIAARTVTIDWFRQYSDAVDFAACPFGAIEPFRGRKGALDLSRKWLGL